jgi:predicted metal-dependent HD superfamily phosphohydrolase
MSQTPAHLQSCALVHAALHGLLPSSVIDDVLARYDEPWRVYHNRSHVLDLFRFAHLHGFKLAPEQALAVLFHDCVYDTKAPRGANERASAELLAARCDHLPFTMVATAHQIILDTIDHVARSTFSHLVLDLDLSPFVLAAQGELDTSRLVWLEYRDVLPKDDVAAAKVFWAARGPVLESFLAKPAIYVSSEFAAHPEFEAQARAHLQLELTKATAGNVP